MNKTSLYYLKDKKARIYHGHDEEDDLGYSTTVYSPRTEAPIWCYAKQLSQDTVYQYHYWGVDESYLFVFNAGTEVARYDQINYRGKWYQVTRVDTAEDYNTDIFVYTKDTAAGDIPALKEAATKADTE